MRIWTSAFAKFQHIMLQTVGSHGGAPGNAQTNFFLATPRPQLRATSWKRVHPRTCCAVFILERSLRGQVNQEPYIEHVPFLLPAHSIVELPRSVKSFGMGCFIFLLEPSRRGELFGYRARAFARLPNQVHSCSLLLGLRRVPCTARSGRHCGPAL